MRSKQTKLRLAHLPTAFYKADLDYFGGHMFDNKGDEDEKANGPMEGKHYFEWKPATSQEEDVYGKVYRV